MTARHTAHCMALGLLLVAGCTINADYSGTRYRCDMSGQCPDGFTCVAGGYCEAVLGPDGGVSDGAVPGGPCGSLAMAVNDFEAAAIDPQKWDVWTNDPGISVDHAQGRLAMLLPAGVGDIGSGYSSEDAYHFTGSRAFVEVVDAQPQSNVSLYFVVGTATVADNGWAIEQQAGELSFWYRVDGNSMQVGSLSYDPEQHRWWQIREQDGTVYWETSADATTWTTHIALASDLTEEFVFVDIETWLTPAEPEPRTLLVDNLSGGAPAAIAWCPPAALTDDFDDGSLGRTWKSWEDDNCHVHEQDGQLSFEYHMAGYGECGIYTITNYDMRDGAFTLAGPTADVGDMYIYLSIWFDDGAEIEFEQGQGMLSGSKNVAGEYNTTFLVPFDPIQHGWWRLRGQDGALYWETSADGITWYTHASHASPPVRLDDANIGIWSYSETGNLNNNNNGFDNLNLAPAP